MQNLYTVIIIALYSVFPVETGFSQTTRPESNTSNGFFVLDGKLFDSHGNEFIPIGANTAVYWQPEVSALNSFRDIKKAGANCVRIISVTNDTVNSWSWQSKFASQKACVKACIENELIPILEFHDVTCGRGYETDREGKYLKKCVDYWCSDSLVTLCRNYEKYLLVNIANEWGPADSSWYGGYKKAIAAMRQAGIKNTLVIDAGGCGQDPTTILNFGQKLIDFDPQHNILLSIHFYGLWMTKDKPKQDWQYYVEDYLPRFKDKKIPLMVGEFGWTGAPDNFTLYTPETIITECNRLGIGWLFWAWNSNPDQPYYNIASDYSKGYTSESDLTKHGNYMVNQWKKRIITNPF